MDYKGRSITKNLKEYYTRGNRMTVCILGGGLTGLTLGYLLNQKGLIFDILERINAVVDEICMIRALPLIMAALT